MFKAKLYLLISVFSPSFLFTPLNSMFDCSIQLWKPCPQVSSSYIDSIETCSPQDIFIKTGAIEGEFLKIVAREVSIVQWDFKQQHSGQYTTKKGNVIICPVSKLHFINAGNKVTIYTQSLNKPLFINASKLFITPGLINKDFLTWYIPKVGFHIKNNQEMLRQPANTQCKK